MPVTDSPFWHFAIALYKHDALRQSLLALQDEYQVVILELLFAVWLADQGINWRDNARQQSRQQTAPWVDEVIVPLRQLRRRWCANAGRDAGYRHLLAMELEAEQHLASLLLAQLPALTPLKATASEALLTANLAWLETEYAVDVMHSRALLAQLAAMCPKIC